MEIQIGVYAVDLKAVSKACLIWKDDKAVAQAKASEAERDKDRWGWVKLCESQEQRDQWERDAYDILADLKQLR